MTIDPLDLFGTDEPHAERRLLKAGPLTAILEDGNLRDHILRRRRGVRAVNYLARDNSWGTYAPRSPNMRHRRPATLSRSAMTALCAGPRAASPTRCASRGEASGRLIMEADGVALTDFPTNRTGFVVLHPAEAAGGGLEIRHTDGSVEKTTYFPQAISPDQPAFDIAAITHEPAPGLSCTVEMEGDAFEMEDQRNWADASYKTYVRPLSKPRPYTIAKGTKDRQRDHRHVHGAAAASAGECRRIAQADDRRGRSARMPKMALFMDPDESVRRWRMPRLGSRRKTSSSASMSIAGMTAALASAKRFAGSIGARLVVEAIFDCRDPQAEATLRRRRDRGRRMSRRARSWSRRAASSRRGRRTRAGQASSRSTSWSNALQSRGFARRSGPARLRSSPSSTAIRPAGDGDFVFFGSAQRACRRRCFGHGNVERLSRDRRQRPETLPGQADLARALHDRHAPQSLWRVCCGTIPAAFASRWPATTRARRAVRRGLRRRRGRPCGRGWCRPFGPGCTDRPLRPARRGRKASPAPGGSCRAGRGSRCRVLCRHDRPAGAGGCRLP